MFLLALLIHSALIAFAQGIPWRGPLKTEHRVGLQVMLPTPAANLRRDGKPTAYPVSLCGWVAGREDTPAWCSSSSSCVWHTDYSVVGCCAIKSNHCAMYTACIDSNSPKPKEDRSDVYTCRGTLECYKNTYPGSYTQWGCGSSDWATAVWRTFSNYDHDLALPFAETGTSTSATSPSTQTRTKTVEVIVTKTPTPTPTSEGETSTSEPETSSTSDENSTSHPPEVVQVSSDPVTPASLTESRQDSSSTPVPAAEVSSSGSEDKKSSTPVGAIAGGVVGGIAGIALIGVAAFFFMRRRRRNGDELDGGSPRPEVRDLSGSGAAAGHNERVSELYSPKQSPGPSELYSPSHSPEPARTVSTMSNPFPGRTTSPPVELP